MADDLDLERARGDDLFQNSHGTRHARFHVVARRVGSVFISGTGPDIRPQRPAVGCDRYDILERQRFHTWNMQPLSAPVIQDLKTFKLPPDFRGRSGVVVQLWWFVQATLFRGSPQVMYGFRRWLLRLFGAQIGKGVIVRPSVTIPYPDRKSVV